MDEITIIGILIGVAFFLLYSVGRFLHSLLCKCIEPDDV